MAGLGSTGRGGNNGAAKKPGGSVVNGSGNKTGVWGSSINKLGLSRGMGSGQGTLLLGQVGLNDGLGIEVRSAGGHGTITGSADQRKIHVQNFTVSGEGVVVCDELKGM